MLPSSLKLADAPYGERLDEFGNPMDRWLAAAYGRWRGFSRLPRSAHLFADQVESHAPTFDRSSDLELADRVGVLGQHLRRHGMRRDAVAETFALIRELAHRRLGMRPYRVQILGAWVLLDGRLAEMETGEGKTLTAMIPAATAALAGTPVHIVTVNDYLALRDARLAAPLYEACGLRVGVIQQGQSPAERQLAYRADITYCTNKELGFDYLKDRIAEPRWPQRGQIAIERFLGGDSGRSSNLLLRGLHFAIVDEADSVLVDEARTPLIIAGPDTSEGEQDWFRRVLEAAASMQRGEDFHLIPSERRARLTDRGVDRLNAMTDSLRERLPTAHARREIFVQALAALHLYQRDKDYLVADDKVQIVDEFTGRVMPDRSWERGLHQLIETKEGCPLSEQRRTLAQITYQRLFRRYLHLSGMTGTAREVAEELWAVYRLRVTRVPTHRPLVRKSRAHRLVTSSAEKWQEICRVIRKEAIERGRPVLVGTRSVEASESLSEVLTMAGIFHQVLNARHDAGEAELIGRAGQAGKVTVATNMAGRGTDIQLGEGVAAAGGLHVILTEFHESSRIDRQLFGRCGRQGDPGSFQAIVATDDELFRLQLPMRYLAGFYSLLDNRWSLAAIRAVAQHHAESKNAQLRKICLEQDRRLDQILAFAGKA